MSKKAMAKPITAKQVTDRTRTRLAAGGRIVIPAEMRSSLGLKEGDAVDLVLEAGSLRLVPSRVVVERAKERIKRLVGPRIGVTDALMEERYAAESKLSGDKTPHKTPAEGDS
jgi:AbrB family looped-hinge helix DNA binding protein